MYTGGGRWGRGRQSANAHTPFKMCLGAPGLLPQATAIRVTPLRPTHYAHSKTHRLHRNRGAVFPLGAHTHNTVGVPLPKREWYPVPVIWAPHLVTAAPETLL